MTEGNDAAQSGGMMVAIGEVSPITRLGLEVILRDQADLCLAASGLHRAALARAMSSSRVDAVVLPQSAASDLAEFRRDHPSVGIALLLDQHDFAVSQGLAALASATCIEADAAPTEVAAALRLAAAHPALATPDDPTARTRSRAASSISPREFEVLALLAEGLSRTRIAAGLAISKHTVDSHLKTLYAKLGVSSRYELRHILPHRRDPGSA